MPEEKKRSFLLLKKLQRLIQSLHTRIFLKNLLIQSGYPEELDHHHPQVLKSPLSNRIELFFRLLLPPGHGEILKGNLSMPSIQIKNHFPQLPSQPEGEPLWKKIGKEAESF